MDQVKESLKASASFIINNTSDESKRLALFAGHYNTDEIMFVTGNSGNTPVLAHCNPAALVAAGYQCDQVADDYSNVTLTRGEGDNYVIACTPKSKRTRVIDFLNYVKLSGLQVAKMRFTDLTDDATRNLFQQEIEVSKSSIGTKGGSDYIQMSTYINPKNFQTNVIEVDLADQNLLLDETTVVIMDVPAKAKFQLDYILG